MENTTEQNFEEQERIACKNHQEFKDADELMSALGLYVNYRKSSKAFADAFKREHRTLQQSAFRMFLELMEEMATENYHTDGRNEDSKKMAQTLLEGFKLAKKQEYIKDGVSEERAESYVTTGDGAKPSTYIPFI
jgi:hypothetical protein